MKEEYSFVGLYKLAKHKNEIEDPSDEPSMDLIIFINRGLQRRKTYNDIISSYGLKHYAEKALNRYVSNIEFKRAMVMCGYYPENPHEINWTFTISSKSFIFKFHSLDGLGGLYDI